MENGENQNLNIHGDKWQTHLKWIKSFCAVEVDSEVVFWCATNGTTVLPQLHPWFIQRIKHKMIKKAFYANWISLVAASRFCGKFMCSSPPFYERLLAMKQSMALDDFPSCGRLHRDETFYLISNFLLLSCRPRRRQSIRRSLCEW